MYRYAKRCGKVDFNPVRDAMQFTVKQIIPRWLRNDEELTLRSILQRWIDECPTQYKQRRLVLRCHPHELTLALGTGMRAGDLYGLRWENVDFEARRINLARTKNGNPHTIPMIDDVFNALKALLSILNELRQVQHEAILKKGEDHQLRMPIDGKVILWATPRKWWLAPLAEAAQSLSFDSGLNASAYIFKYPGNVINGRAHQIVANRKVARIRMFGSHQLQGLRFIQPEL